MTHFRLFLLTLASLAVSSLLAQTPSNVEAAEHEPNSDRWFVSNGNSILVTADEGESWSVFGDGGATHGMEVLGTTLFAIQSNVIRAFDVVTGEQLGSLSPAGVGFLNGMGSESGPFGDLLVVSDFAEGSLLRIDVSDPTDMVASTRCQHRHHAQWSHHPKRRRHGGELRKQRRHLAGGCEHR